MTLDYDEQLLSIITAVATEEKYNNIITAVAHLSDLIDVICTVWNEREKKNYRY